MKPFELKSPSKQAEMKMKRKLFFLEIQHNLKSIFSFSSLKIGLQAFVFAVFTIFWLHTQNILASYTPSPQQEKYISQLQNVTKQTTADYYKKYAMIRNMK